MQALNPQQQEATSHGRQPLLIIAGAGTGKTATLAHRVAHLIANGTHPARICLLTFTRRAAAEMLRRADEVLRHAVQQKMAGVKPALGTGKVCGGTFHAVAVRMLRRDGKIIGLAPGFTIHDRADSEDLMRLLRDELQLAKSDKLFPLKEVCMAVYSRCINARLPLREVLRRHYPWCQEHEEGLKRLFKAYTERKEEQGMLFDDLYEDE